MTEIQRCLVTGASGFIGSAICQLFADQGISVRGASRRDMSSEIADWVEVGDLAGDTDWATALEGCDVVVHTAARAHVLSELSVDPLAVFREVNVRATLALARQAMDAGIKRFVFLSSIGVNGALSDDGPFTEDSVPRPHAPYAVSKLEAEQGLRALLAGSGTELVIIRPPLVYAANAPGNFGKLLRVIQCGMPLPFGRIRNARSFIALDNLVDFIRLCVVHPAAANQLFLLSDGQDVSTPELVRLLGEGMHRPARLLPVPLAWLKFFFRMTGRSAMFHQLSGRLQIDSSKSFDLLGWRPPTAAYEALKAVGSEYYRN